MNVDAFHVSRGRHWMSGAVQHARPLWRGLGNLESKIVRGQLEQTPIVKPVYVCGLARAGTTVLTEVVASHPHVATHQYRDFPFLFIPYWWRQTLEKQTPVAGAGDGEAPAERAHGDRLVVTSRSPEAMEEVLWMAFFKHLHDPDQRNTLDAATDNLRFERFYRDHIRKLLLIAGRPRYAAKENYNLTRLEYLLKLFPDARFVVAVREPREHVASLMKQHRLFTAAAERHPRSVAHLDRVGHFEFGAHRRCVNANGDARVVESIESLWHAGDDVRGWARYWAYLYGWLAERLNAREELRRATLVLRYEDLCDRPEESLNRLLAHTDLSNESDELVARWAPQLSRPTYYDASFTDEQERALREETDATVESIAQLAVS